MQQNNLIPLDINNDDHLNIMYTVRTHPLVIPFLRGSPPADFVSHITYLQNLPPQKQFFLIQTNLSLCGYCQITYETIHIEIGIALHPDFCNKGIGSFVLLQLLKLLSTQNKSIILFVKKDNIRAIALYEKYGFKQNSDENEYGEYRMEFHFKEDIIL